MKRIFEIWPSLSDMAEEMAKPYPTVAAWKQRNSIPAKYDHELVRCAKARGVHLTYEQIASERSPQTPEAAAE